MYMNKQYFSTHCKAGEIQPPNYIGPSEFKRANAARNIESKHWNKWKGGHQESNSAPTLSPVWIRLMASAIMGATEMILI